MNTISDSYKTLQKPSAEILYKEKNSKFFGYAFPVTSEENVKKELDILKKRHHTARHWCYAFRLGTTSLYYRVNDDGEPKNSAGMPIYGQIKAFNLTQVLVVVVRYFGGVKLGVGGLISAYKTTAQITLENTTIIEKTINKHYILLFQYEEMNKVMRIIKEKNITIENQKMEMSCEIEISIRKSNAKIVEKAFSSLFKVQMKEKE